jgi:PAS domain S-box-containing protein
VIYSFKASGDYAPTFISRNVKDLLGYEREDYLRSPDFWLDRLHPGDRARILEEFPRLFEEGRLNYEYRFRKKDGSYCWINDEMQVLRDAHGAATEVVGAWNDISARKQIGEALVAAQDRIGHLLSSAPSVIYSFRATGDYAPTFVSQNIRERLGYEPQDYLENADFWRSRVHPDDLAAVEAQSVQLFKDGVHTFEYRFRKNDGSYFWVNDEQRLVRDENGEPVEIVGSWSDISERKRAEAAVAEAHQRIEHLLASSPAGSTASRRAATTGRPSSARTSRTSSATTARTISRAPTSGRTACIRPTARASCGPIRASSRRGVSATSTGSARKTAAIAGSATNCR